MQVKRLYSTELAELLGNQTKLVALPEKKAKNDDNKEEKYE